MFKYFLRKSLNILLCDIYCTPFMAQFTFDEIKIFDDTLDDMDIIKTSTECQEKVFLYRNIGNIIL